MQSVECRLIDDRNLVYTSTDWNTAETVYSYVYCLMSTTYFVSLFSGV